MSRPSKKNIQTSPVNFPDAHDILMNAPIGIFTSTPEGRYLSANPGMARMLGYDSPEELLKSITDIATQVFVNPEDRQEFMRLMQKHGKVIDHECRFMRKNESEFWVSINAHAVKDEDGLVEVYQTFIRDITERKQAEESLRLQSLVLDQIEDRVTVTDLSGKITYVNQAEINSLGYTREEILTQSTEIYGEDPQRGATQREMLETTIREGHWQGEVVNYAKDGGERILDCRTQVVRDEKGQPVALCGIATDITDRKRAEAELAEQKARYQGIWEESPVSIWEEDWSGVITILQRLQDQGIQDYRAYFDQHPEVVEEALRAVKILDVNEETVRMFRGRDKDDFMHSLETLFATPDTLPGFIGELVALVEGRSTYRTEMRLRGVDKELIHVLLTMSFFPKNTKPGTVLVSLVDITDKKKAERDLKLERERFFMLLETFPGFIYLQSPDYSVRYANKYFIEQFGNPKGRLCYEVLWKRTAPCEICPTFKVFDTKKSQVWEWLQAPDGRSYAIHDYPFTDGDGTELVLEVGIDITERKMAEENIRAINEQLQKVNAEKDKLFSIIAHDLKSPMAGVYSTSQILAEEAESLSLEEISYMSTAMHKSSKNALELLNDLMQWARMSQGGMDFSPDSCSLYELVNSSLSTARDMAGKKDIAIRSDIPEDLTVLVDQSMIKTVIRNVIINAVKFSYRGGNISITASQAGPYVQVCISDNGIGMSEKILSTVFSADKSKRRVGTDGEKGTGLGLVLCKEFVEKHGGRIWVESEPGKGTKVFFTLPGES